MSSHACGSLTDRILERAAAARARVAVLPCCHNLATADAGELRGWVDGALAIDIARAARLKARVIGSGPRPFRPTSRRRTVCCSARRSPLPSDELCAYADRMRIWLFAGIAVLIAVGCISARCPSHGGRADGMRVAPPGVAGERDAAFG